MRFGKQPLPPDRKIVVINGRRRVVPIDYNLELDILPPKKTVREAFSEAGKELFSMFSLILCFGLPMTIIPIWLMVATNGGFVHPFTAAIFVPTGIIVSWFSCLTPDMKITYSIGGNIPIAGVFFWTGLVTVIGTWFFAALLSALPIVPDWKDLVFAVLIVPFSVGAAFLIVGIGMGAFDRFSRRDAKQEA